MLLIREKRSRTVNCAIDYKRHSKTVNFGMKHLIHPIQIGLLLVLLLFLVGNRSWAFANAPKDTIYTSSITTFRDIWAETTLYVDTANREAFLHLPAQTYRHDSLYFADVLPKKQVFFPHYLRFLLHNDLADTVRLYFYVDMQEAIALQEENLTTHQVQELPVKEYSGRGSTGTQAFLLTILPGQTLQYTAKAIPLKSRHSILSPALIQPDYIAELFQRDYWWGFVDLLQFMIFCGMLLMMLLYISFKYLQVRSSEYLYYAGYILLFLCYFFQRGNALNLAPVQRIPFFAYYWESITQIAAYCFYFAFFRQFLNIPRILPRLDTMLRWATVTLILYILLDFILFFFPKTYPLRWLLWDSVRAALILFSIVAIFIIVRIKNKLMAYIFTGSIAVVFCGLLAMVLSFYPAPIANFPVPLRSPLFYFQLGITIELICFALGLGYKNKRDEIEKTEAQEALKIEQTQKEFDRYKASVEARESERKRIATEMHDDIGSGLTSILFLSNVIHRNAQNGQAEVTEKITAMASGLVDQMSNIIWSMNKDYDTLPDMIAYVRSHISELLTNAELDYTFHVQEPIPDDILNGEQRRNIYLVIKEAVHNIIKHAQATQVRIQFRYEEDLFITIDDNGKGMTDATGRKFGNGLKNMQQRMQDIGGEFSLLPGEKGGTQVRMRVPVSKLFATHA